MYSYTCTFGGPLFHFNSENGVHPFCPLVRFLWLWGQQIVIFLAKVMEQVDENVWPKKVCIQDPREGVCKYSENLGRFTVDRHRHTRVPVYARLWDYLRLGIPARCSYSESYPYPGSSMLLASTSRDAHNGTPPGGYPCMLRVYPGTVTRYFLPRLLC